MGDWNVSPAEFEKSGWLKKVGGKIVQLGKATSHAGKGERTIDYFVVAASLEAAGAVLSCDTLGTGIVATHEPVELRLAGDARSVKVKTLMAPKAFPTERPVGCQREPRAHRDADPEQESVKERVAQWTKDVEEELCDFFDLTGEVAEKHCGRSSGPRFQWKCQLGRPGGDRPATTPKALALRELGAKLKEAGRLMLHGSQAHSGNSAMPGGNLADRA